MREFATVASTQDAARELADQGAPSLSVVVADQQTAGRGRYGRRWVAAPGTALTMSVVLRPNVPIQRLPQVAMAIGLGALEALDNLGNGARSIFALKWPNDLVVDAGQAKVGGVLIETSIGGGPADGSIRLPRVSASPLESGPLPPGEGPDTVVVLAGIGINVLQTRAELVAGSTSLAVEGLPGVDREQLRAAVVMRIGDFVASVEAGVDLTARWRARLATLGREVVATLMVEAGVAQLRGRAIDVTDAGGLVLELADGSRQAVFAGDVTLAPVTGPP